MDIMSFFLLLESGEMTMFVSIWVVLRVQGWRF